jgi:anthranilate 1,2-dioxygenase large subunit
LPDAGKSDVETSEVASMSSLLTGEKSTPVEIQVDWEKKDFSRVPYRLMHDKVVYEAERRNIFSGPVWIFLGLEAEIPNVGDFRATYAGDIPVIFNRGRDKKIYAFVNRCSHRGSTVRREICGNAKAHTCIYHRWGFDLQGRLQGIPFQRGVDGEGGLSPEFDKSQHNLRAFKIETIAGVIFGSLSEDIVSLKDYLGPQIVDHLLRLFHKPIRILGYQRQQIEGNWKSYVENVKDTYHASLLHTFLSTFGIDRATQRGGVLMDSRHRHSVTYSYANSDTDEIAKGAYTAASVRDNSLRLLDDRMVRYVPEWPDNRGLVLTAVFPTAFFMQISNCLHTRQVRLAGPDKLEVYQTIFCYEDDTEEMVHHRLRQANLVGPAGLVSMEDGEAIELVHRATAVESGATEVIEMGGGGPIIDKNFRVNDVSLRGFWSYYAELMGVFPEGAVQ